MIRAHKIALVPNHKQRTFFAKSAGTARFAYNWGLNRWKELYNENQKVSEASLRKELNARKKEEFPWMSEVGKCAPQQAMKDLGTAYDRFFKKVAKYPNFKKKANETRFESTMDRRKRAITPLWPVVKKSKFLDLVGSACAKPSVLRGKSNPV